MIYRVQEIGPLLRKRYGQPVRKVCLSIGATCPNRDRITGGGGCIFCGESKRIANNTTSISSWRETLQNGIVHLQGKAAIIAYLQDHTITHFPPEQLRSILTCLATTPEVVAITLGTRPDCLPTIILNILEETACNKELLIELGLQTANDKTLSFIQRQHTVDCFVSAVERLHQRELKVCAHVILGLPTPEIRDHRFLPEGIAEAIDTARLLGTLGIRGVKIHNCHILEGTRLAELYKQGVYCPPDLDGYLERLVAFIEYLPSAMEIHRLVGEARFPELLTPSFTAEKNHTVQRIRDEFEKRDTWQGRKVGALRPEK